MSSHSTHPKPVDLLILGYGWTGPFLAAQCDARKLSYAKTTRDGRDGSIKFQFDPSEAKPGDEQHFQRLPESTTVLIVFPIYGSGGSKRLVELYLRTHPGSQAGFVQLGSTGIWDGGPTLQSEKPKLDPTWVDRHSPFNTTNKRAIAETELLSLSSSQNPTTVLNLCGLWGGSRNMRNYVSRVAPSKEVLSGKTSIHMIHGDDVAQLIIACHTHRKRAEGQRFLATDFRVYDWWDLASKFGTGGEKGRDEAAQGPQPRWVAELMAEHNVRSLPRTPEQLGRAMTSVDMWQLFEIAPIRGGLD